MAAGSCWDQATSGSSCGRKTGFGRKTQPREVLQAAISKDMGERLTTFYDLNEALRAVASLFALNEMELAAWYCCLREIPTMDLDYQRLSLLIWLTAFHAKTTLDGTSESTTQRLRLNDPNFAYHMQEWRATRAYFNPLSFMQISDSYRRLISLAKKVEVVKSANDRVDELVVTNLQVTVDRSKQDTEDSSESEAEVYMACQDTANEEFVWPYGKSLRAYREWATDEHSFMH